MLNKLFKFSIIAPVFMTGVFISSAIAQTKPSIQALTSDKTAKAVESGEIGSSSSNDRIPGEINKHSVGLAVGQTILMGDFKKHGENKITPDVYYGYSASHSFDLLANLHISKHKAPRQDVTIRGLAVSIKAKGYQYDSFSPFILGGVGFYMPTMTHNTDEGPYKTSTKLVFGLNLGAGAELRLNENASIGIIAHYHDPFDVKQDAYGDVGGSYMKLLLMGMYTFN